jgi:hypothetical protein
VTVEVYSCDGCQTLADGAGPDQPPPLWLSVTMVGGATEVIRSKNFCPTCAPKVETYMEGKIT